MALEKLGINLNFLVAQLVNFLILLALLRLFLYKPVLNMLAERRQRIKEGLEAAEKAKEEAARERAEFEKKLEEERKLAQQRIAEATRASEKAREEIIKRAQEEAREIVARAREDAEKERERILAEARKQVAELTILSTQKVLGRMLDENLQKQLIQEFLAEGEVK
jgi:F-type H+-transporting ATPase subunit b